MEPNEALGIAAQVAVTLAGFAGIVVVFYLNRCTNGRAWTGFASGCCSAIPFFRSLIRCLECCYSR